MVSAGLRRAFSRPDHLGRPADLAARGRSVPPPPAPGDFAARNAEPAALMNELGQNARLRGHWAKPALFTVHMTENPATGSATSAVTAPLTGPRGGAALRLRVGQGTDMGRPGSMLARAKQEGGTAVAFVGGRCVKVMGGGFVLGRDGAAPPA